MTDATRFWAKVAQVGNVCECWPWTAVVDYKGYGQFWDRIRRVMAKAHRIAFQLTYGEIKPGMVIDHLCRNRVCVNPWHLEQVSSAENTRRTPRELFGAANRSKTHCKRGHEFSIENTYRWNGQPGQRKCKICKSENFQNWKSRHANRSV